MQPAQAGDTKAYFYLIGGSKQQILNFSSFPGENQDKTLSWKNSFVYISSSPFLVRYSEKNIVPVINRNSLKANERKIRLTYSACV